MNSTPNSSLKTGLLLLVLLVGGASALVAQTSKKTPAKSPAAEGVTKTLPDGYTLLASGLEYKVITHGKGKRKPVLTDHIELHISYQVGDSVIFDSRKVNNDNPVPIPVAKPRGPGDPAEVFVYLVAGDSAVVRFPVDSIKGGQLPPGAKKGDKMIFKIKMVSVKTEAEDKKDNEEKAAKQMAIDDKILADYFKKNNLKPLKTASGLYYIVSEPGHGEVIKPGFTADVNYTGMYMDGKKFDSNVDSTFHHMQPLSVEVGKGHVIKGWDEGLQLLKPGSKATFYIPSPLAYGPVEKQGMPANSILLFDVEIVAVKSEEEVKVEKKAEMEKRQKEMEEKQKEAKANASRQAETDEKLLQDYFAKNNLKPTRTASGLYYTITVPGTGDNLAAGKKVSMNYTGKLLDGTPFDSNTDPKFNHVTPFTFPLGQGRVIKGWDEGVQLLKVGSKGTLYIPSGLGYGAQGAGKQIPPNSVLIFDVEVTSADN